MVQEAYVQGVSTRSVDDLVAHVVRIFPNENAVIRLVGAIPLEQNDEWAVQRSRYVALETIALLSDDVLVKLPNMAA